MPEKPGNGNEKLDRSLTVLAMVNAGVWALSLIALVFVLQRCPSAKGLFPILAGGSAVATLLISTIRRRR